MSEKAIVDETALFYKNEYEKLKKETDKKLEEKDKELDKYKKKNPKNEHKSPGWMENLRPLQAKFNDDWLLICKYLQEEFLEDRHDVVKRRICQMSLMGILWTEGIAIPQIGTFRNNEALESLHETSLQLDLDFAVWENFEETDKREIISWVNEFRVNPNVKPEALILSNLWGYLLRKITMCIEKVCDSDHTQRSKLQCFPEFNTSSIEAMGKTFFTDFVLTAGCKGLPQFFAELESHCLLDMITQTSTSINNRVLSKDLKKLSVQMAGALLEMLSMVKKFNEAAHIDSRIDISVLRSFGALITNFNVEFFVSRIKTYNDGRFVIIFESHKREWSFNLLQDLNEIPQHQSRTTLNFNEENFSEADFDSDSALENESEDEPQEPPLPSSGYDYSAQIGTANIRTLKAMTQFLWHVHEYYSSLDEVLLDMYMRPNDFEKDPSFWFPDDVHDILHTTAGVTPQSTQNTLHESINSSILNVDSYTENFDVPTHYIFPTLPVIFHIMRSVEDPIKSIIRYLDGMSLSQMENIIDQGPVEDLESDRVYYRSTLILNIVMAIYMASKSGIAFEQFTHDEITFRNGMYCIKTYSQARHISNDFTVLESAESFRSFYRRIFFMDKIMMGSDPDYEHLTKIEKIVFGRIRKFKRNKETMSEEDWIKLFTDSKAEFGKILNDRSCLSRKDPTWFLLDSLLTLIDESRDTTAEPPFPRKKSLASSPSEQTSSVETIPIDQNNDPSAKMSEIALVETEEAEQEETLTIA